MVVTQILLFSPFLYCYRQGLQNLEKWGGGKYLITSYSKWRITNQMVLYKKSRITQAVFRFGRRFLKIYLEGRIKNFQKSSPKSKNYFRGPCLPMVDHLIYDLSRRVILQESFLSSHDKQFYKKKFGSSLSKNSVKVNAVLLVYVTKQNSLLY